MGDMSESWPETNGPGRVEGKPSVQELKRRDTLYSFRSEGLLNARKTLEGKSKIKNQKSKTKTAVGAEKYAS